MIFEKSVETSGKITSDFAAVNKWPNIAGRFEFVSNPDISRRPEQNFFVQIKGTHYYEERNEDFYGEEFLLPCETLY